VLGTYSSEVLCAIPAGKQGDLSEPAVQGVQYCEALFKIERYCREHKFTAKQHHEYRNKKAPPILKAFWAWLDKQNPTKGSRLDKAVTYARNQKIYAENYLQDGRCSFSNNLSENSIRPVTLAERTGCSAILLVEPSQVQRFTQWWRWQKHMA